MHDVMKLRLSVVVLGALVIVMIVLMAKITGLNCETTKLLIGG